MSAILLLAAVLAIPGPVQAGLKPAQEGRKPEPMNARTLLEQGRASGALPDGMVLRLDACLGEPEVKAPGDRVPDELRETWEFASHQVRRIVWEEDQDKGPVQRVETRPFDSKDLCKHLLEGKAIEIQARKGKGPTVAFAGTHYGRGSRSLQVLWNGQSILDLHEGNGPFLDLYRETDARDFGALYERLANQARRAFQSKAGDTR